MEWSDGVVDVEAVFGGDALFFVGGVEGSRTSTRRRNGELGGKKGMLWLRLARPSGIT
jgi:hypothetical protein